MSPRSPWMSLTATALVLQVLAGCAAKVGVAPISDQKWFERANRSALDTKKPSLYTETYLRTHDLEDDFRARPIDVLTELDRKACAEPDLDLAFAIAELSYLAGKRTPDTEMAARLHATSAAYAFAALFDERLDETLEEYDPRFRMACEFNNRSCATMLAYARATGSNERDVVEVPMLRGRALVSRGEQQLQWPANSLSRIIPAYRFQVVGFENHYRQFGLGVPMICVRNPDWIAESRPQDAYVPRYEVAFGATLVVEPTMSVFDRTDAAPDLQAIGNIYDPLRDADAEVAGRIVPLEFDLTTTLAYSLANMPLRSGMEGLIDVEAWDDERGLHMLAPYTPGKIPIVFVHGLMSTPITWIGMFNELLANETIRERYQFWFFQYPTGNPIFYSAAVLRRTLLETRELLDPDHADPALDEMVLVGHSMGGILSKTMVQSSGDAMWQTAFEAPYEEMSEQLDPAGRELLREVCFFEPVPSVRRVIFISSPHRGSELATGFIGWLGTSLVKLPSNLMERAASIVEVLDKEHDGRKIATGVDGLSPENPSLQVTAEIPIDDGVPYHSIHGNEEAEGVPDGTDGIVPYWSSHLEGAESELIVESGHSAHKHPLAILEVERILMLNLEELDE